jgi:dimethylamine monooxygenase subunit A
VSAQPTDPQFHTPYDGSSKPFTIGTQPLALAQWIEVDRNLSTYLAEKQRLYASIPDKVIVAEDGTADAQFEVLELLTGHLSLHFPAIYHRRDSAIDVLNGLYRVELDDASLPPIAIAAKLVQEDLVLMRRSREGWRLVAASLCFPSAWNLLEKFGRPLHAIHKPVPGFGEGTRNAAMLERMFDRLHVDQPVLRWNWSLHEDAKLYHPHSHSGIGSRFGEGDLTGRVILRLERQTLRKLSRSGDILFTIRIHLDPLEVLERRAEGAVLAGAIDAQLSAMSAPEAHYKGIIDERQRLSARLKKIALQAG